MNRKVFVIVPARIGSTRLKEKPLADLNGKTLIERVMEKAANAKKVNKVFAASDSQKVIEIVENAGFECVMTDENIQSGTERVFQAASQVEIGDEDIIINLQGDMPFITPESIDDLIDFFLAKPSFDMATLAIPIREEEILKNPNDVKVVVGEEGNAIYFSRSPIPFSRDGLKLNYLDSEEVYGYKHLGIYIFSMKSLKKYVSLKPSQIEKIEMLEQLRALHHQMTIGVKIVNSKELAKSIEIDTEEDLKKAINVLRQSGD